MLHNSDKKLISKCAADKKIPGLAPDFLIESNLLERAPNYIMKYKVGVRNSFRDQAGENMDNERFSIWQSLNT